jgi:RimJ/RimL family protein N-acetyltransferase
MPSSIAAGLVSPWSREGPRARRETWGVTLQLETTHRVQRYWRDWAVPVSDAVAIVDVGGERYMRAPDRLRPTLEAEHPRDLAALLAVLGDEAGDRFGAALLSYVDERAARLMPHEGVVELSDRDGRVEELESGADEAEWRESISGHVWQRRLGIVQDQSLLALCALEVWDDDLCHLGAFTAAPARNRGLAGAVVSAAMGDAFDLGLVPQWRCQLGNDASLRVAQKLGFVQAGTQMFARIRPS